jgi:hypothetical protein
MPVAQRWLRADAMLRKRTACKAGAAASATKSDIAGQATAPAVRRRTQLKPSAFAQQQGQDKQNNKDQEQHFGDAHGCASDAAKTQDTGDYRDDKEYQRVMQHEEFPWRKWLNRCASRMMQVPSIGACQVDLCTSSHIGGDGCRDQSRVGAQFRFGLLGGLTCFNVRTRRAAARRVSRRKHVA